jgi:hypothetical protein
MMKRPTTWGRYRLESLVARGGMAEIFAATRIGGPRDGETVCVKRIRPEFGDDPEFRDMFRREAAIAAALDHPNIVRVHDLDEHAGRLFLVMDYVDGLDLRHALRRAGALGLRLPVGFAIHVMTGLLHALRHAQELRIDGVPRAVVHRDVSPHNILLSSQGDVKLTDFGIAKARGATSATRTGVLKGKLAYLSPEQASGGEVGPRADLFCAGIVLWEMLCGRRLFARGADQEVLAQVISAEIPAIPWLSADLEAFLGRLLARDPADRFASASAAIDALSALGARPCSPGEAATLVRALVAVEAADPDTVGRTVGSGDAAAPADGEARAGEGSIEAEKTRTSMADEPLPAIASVPERTASGRRVIAAALAAAVAIGLIAFLVIRSQAVGDRAPEVAASLPGSSLAHAPNGDEAVESRVAAPSTAEPPVVNLSATPAEGDPAGEGPGPPAVVGAAAAEGRDGSGFLEVNCRPWASVSVDGEGVGTTPIKRLRLSAGNHRVTLNNDAKGYSKTFTVKVKPGKTVRLNKEIP